MNVLYVPKSERRQICWLQVDESASVSTMQDFSTAGLKKRAMDRRERKIVVVIQGHTFRG